MNRRQLIFLGAAALIIAVLAVFLSQRQAGQHAPAQRTRLFPELESALNTVTRVQIHGAGAAPFTIRREGETWRVKEKAAYPADFKRLKETLISLARLERVEAMTRRQENYPRLGVADMDKAEGNTREVQVWAHGETPLASVLIGNTGSNGHSYVRKTGEAQSWLGSVSLNVPGRAQDWLDRELVDLEVNRVQRVDLHPGGDDGETYSVVRTDATGFHLEPLPEGRRARPGQLQRIGSALSRLQLSDVMADAQAPSGGAPWSEAVFRTHDGLVIQVRSRKLEDKHYLKLATRFESTPPPNEAPGSGDQATGDREKDRPAPEQVRAEAKRLQQRFEGRTFVVPGYAATPLGLTIEDLTEEDKPQERSEQDKPQQGQAQDQQAD
jgi:hypothetical protein